MSKTTSASKQEALALATFTRLSKTAGRLRRKVYSALNDTRLTESQVNVLELLHKLGPLPQKEIAKNLSVTGGNITMVVDNLQKRNLVNRQRWEEDRRVVHVNLTDLGQDTIESFIPLHAQRVLGALDALEPQEQEQLQSLCEKLIKSLN
jgi:MarR family transcriptional regulator, 2-MHQ and catechol-resistance regulon repressor